MNSHYSIGGVIEIQTAITKTASITVALKFTVHAFIKGHKILSDFNKAF